MQQRVLPSEGNEVRQDERSGFGAFHSTGEVGELSSRGPDGGKGKPSQRTVGGQHGRNTEFEYHVTATTTDSGVTLHRQSLT